MMKKCSEENCDRPHSAKGLCKPHYEQRAYLAQHEERKAKARAHYAANRDRILRATRLAMHGVSDEEYERLLASQNHGCAICGRGPQGRKQRLCVDHCHAVGHVRGLLCDACNRGIGLLGDDIDRLNRAIAYLTDSS